MRGGGSVGERQGGAGHRGDMLHVKTHTHAPYIHYSIPALDILNGGIHSRKVEGKRKGRGREAKKQDKGLMKDGILYF